MTDILMRFSPTAESAAARKPHITCYKKCTKKPSNEKIVLSKEQRSIRVADSMHEHGYYQEDQPNFIDSQIDD